MADVDDLAQVPKVFILRLVSRCSWLGRVDGDQGLQVVESLLQA